MKHAKKRAFHFEKKSKKDDRKVLSYEELPLEQYEDTPEEKKKVNLDKKKILIACTIVVILVLAVVLVFTAGSCDSCSGIQNGAEFTENVSGSAVEPGNFQGFGEGLAYASDTGFVYLSSQGEVIYKEQLKFKTPVLKVAGSKAIVFDCGAKEFAVFSDTKKTYSGKTDSTVYLADITSEGVYALITDESGYNGKLTVYSPDNSVRYEYSFSDYYITSASLNSRGDEAVICGVSAEGGTFKSAVYVLSFKQQGAKAFKSISQDIILDCDYLSDDAVCVVGKEKAYTLKGGDFSEFGSYSYEGMTLTAYDINSDMDRLTLSLSRSGDGRNCNIVILNARAEAENVLETDEKLTSLSTFKDRIAALSGSSVMLYNDKGELLENREVLANQKQLRFLSTHWLYVLGIDQITSIHF